MSVTCFPVESRCALNLGNSCLNLATAAFPSTIKHHVVPSTGPAFMADFRVDGMKGWMDCNMAFDSRDKSISFAKVGDSFVASSIE